MLLQLRRGTAYLDGWWACGAAGHVEAGESVLTAATREAREELGVQIDPADLEPAAAVRFPEIDPAGWTETSREARHGFSFVTRARAEALSQPGVRPARR